MNLELVYEPKGKAREFAPLACNFSTSCEHRCKYCFGPNTLHKSPDDFYGNPSPKKEALKKLKRDVTKLSGDSREILLSFVTDPYQSPEVEQGITREAIKILIAYNLRFTILTKGGMRAVRDFDLLASYPHARFGSTLVFNQQADADIWEPNAPSIQDRIDAIQVANAKGISTWVSLEPVIDPVQALDLIKELHPIVDHWKVGKLNYQNLAVD